MNSNAIVDQAFAALEETAKIVRGQTSSVSKDAKKKNAAYWHAMLFSAVSKNPTKLQAVRQRLEQWIVDDMDSCVPIMLGKQQQNTNTSSSPVGTTTKNEAVSSAATISSPTTTDASVPKTKEQQIEEDIAAAFLVDEAAIQRICDSFSAYKQIAFAATVIFEVVGSSKTGKIDINKMMMNGYRDRIFDQVRGTLFKFVAYHVTLCRRKEELLPSGGGLLKSACRMFATVAMQYDAPEDRKWFYDNMFVRRYHSLALQEARRDVTEFLRQPSALEGLLSWAEERISFEMRLVDLFLHDDEQVGSADVNNPFAGIRFRKQLQSVFIVSRLEEILSHPTYGFAANLASGNWARLRQQFSWAAAEKDRVPAAGKICTSALVDFAKNQVADNVIATFNDQVFETVTAAAVSFISSLMDLLKMIFSDLISSFVTDDGAASLLQRPVRKEISKMLSSAKLKRRTGNEHSKTNKTVAEAEDHFANLFCIYLDLVLRDPKHLPLGSNGGDSDYPAFARNQVYDLFSILEDRDVFAEHYRLRLSKRLLQTNWEEDNERAFLEVMQRQVGKLYTHKFEGMIFDVQSAQSLQENYVDSSSSSFQINLEPKVLTAAFWPTLKRDDDFVVPEPLQEQIGVFERFYRKKFPTRQLRWQAERGTALLSVAFPKGAREVSCSIYQAAVMMAIDEASVVTNGEIIISSLASKTGIELKELKPLVASMLLAKGLYLIRTCGSNPLNPKFGENDAVQMNPTFTCRIRKIKLPSAVTARSVASDSVGQNVIDASRGQMLDAAIVRIMKSRKEMILKELIDLVINQVTKFFIPQPRDIKMRVEFLIQKEFLERDEDENDVFRYLA